MNAESIENKTVIVKVTSGCNLECSYCYYHPSRGNNEPFVVMSKDLLSRLVEQVLRTIPGNIGFIWHGGEPLLAGKEFFEEILKQQKRFEEEDRIVTNSIQTNATLLNDEWVDFLYGNDFDIGVSLDGPSHVQNKFRMDGQGEGSYLRAMNGLKSLLGRESSFGLLSVVTQYGAKFPDEVFDFFVSNGLLRFDFLPCVDVNPQRSRLSNYAVAPEDFADFMIRIFDLWMNQDNPDIKIRYLESIIALLIGGNANLCAFADTCSGFITIDYKGDIYPCDCLIADWPFLFGNLLNDSLYNILTSVQYKKFLDDVQCKPSGCTKCKWFSICKSGCSQHRFMVDRRFDSRNYFCEANFKIIEHVNSKIDSIFERARNIAEGEAKIV